jgi:hypothetical protein
MKGLFMFAMIFLTVGLFQWQQVMAKQDSPLSLDPILTFHPLHRLVYGKKLYDQPQQDPILTFHPLHRLVYGRSLYDQPQKAA